MLRQMQYLNENNVLFNIVYQFVSFSLLEFCLVTDLGYFGNGDIDMLEKKKNPSRLKTKYFSQVKIVTNEDVKCAFLSVDHFLG